MSKRIQAIISEQATEKLNRIHAEAVNGFKMGKIKLSDVLTEMILSSEVDIKELRAKNTNLSKSLVNMAKNKTIDVDTAIKQLQEIKNKTTKKTLKNSSLQEELKV